MTGPVAEIRKTLLRSKLLDTVQKLASRLGSRQAALIALRDLLHDGVQIEDLTAVMQEVGVETAELEKLIETYDPVLDLLVGNLSDLEGHDPVKLSHEQPIELGVGSLSLNALAEIEADSDGEALDGRIEFEEGKEIVVRVGVVASAEGEVEGDVGNAEAGLTGNGSIAVNNYFLHSGGEPALTSLVEDLADLTIPRQIRRADDLRSRLAHPHDERICIPAQWVHLRGEAKVELQGAFSWSQSLLTGKQLNTGVGEIDDNVTIDAGASASVSFSHGIEGTFDIVARRSEAARERVRVELHRSRGTTSSLGVEVGAEVGISGIDVAGKAVLDQFVPKIDQFVGSVEKAIREDGGAVDRFKALFAAKLEGSLDKALGQVGVIDEIDQILKKIGREADLRADLKELFRESGVRLAEAKLEAIEANLEEVRKALGRLIQKYRDTLSRINRILEKAAQVKIGISVAHARRRSREREVFLAFEIDPGRHPRIFQKMLRAEFTEALALAAEADGGLDLVDGLLFEKGSLQVSNTLDITAYKFRFNHAGILKQDWDYQISLSGEVSIGVTSSLEGRISFGATRTLTFLADSRVVALVSGSETLEDVELRHGATLELADGFKLKPKRLVEAQQTLLELGVISAGDGSLQALSQLHSGERVLITSLMELGRAELTAIVEASDAREIFARSLATFATEDEMSIEDEHGVPVLLWSSVDRRFRPLYGQPWNALNGDQSWAPQDASGREITGWSPGRTRVLFHRWQYVEAFSRSIEQLRNLRHLQLGGLDSQEVLQRLRKRQRALMDEARLLVAGRPLGSRVNYAFFKTIFTLAGRAGTLDPFAVVQVGTGEEGQRFVIG